MPLPGGSSSVLPAEQGGAPGPHAPDATSPIVEAVAPPPHADAGEAAALQRQPRGRLHAALSTLRPRQWIKNALVIAAPGAAGALGHDDVPLRVGIACIAFCLLASGIYAINDVRDAEEDRRHPRKRYRAVAAGEISPATAVGLGVALIVAGLALCAAARPLVAAVGAGYVLLTLSYTLVWRHLLLLDMVAIAGGFVLRAIAGGTAAPVALSRWFMLVVIFAALFVAAGKRWAELARSMATLSSKRRVLHAYDGRVLRVILVLSAAGTLVAYVGWALQLPQVHGVPWRTLTILPFAVSLLRYGVLLHRGEGEAPEDVLLADRWLQLAALLWLGLFAAGVHAAS